LGLLLLLFFVSQWHERVGSTVCFQAAAAGGEGSVHACKLGIGPFVARISAPGKAYLQFGCGFVVAAEMASSAEKALLDQVQLMGDTQGEWLFQHNAAASLLTRAGFSSRLGVILHASVSCPCLISSGSKKATINSELWHACAGPLVCLPRRGSLVYYFPQGHSEQVRMDSEYSFFPLLNFVLIYNACGYISLPAYTLKFGSTLKLNLFSCMQVAATTRKTPNSRIPNYPSLSSQLLCQLHNITLHVSASKIQAQCLGVRPNVHPLTND
jgi:hypothetical protein